MSVKNITFAESKIQTYHGDQLPGQVIVAIFLVEQRQSLVELRQQLEAAAQLRDNLQPSFGRLLHPLAVLRLDPNLEEHILQLLLLLNVGRGLFRRRHAARLRSLRLSLSNSRTLRFLGFVDFIPYHLRPHRMLDRPLLLYHGWCFRQPLL